MVLSETRGLWLSWIVREGIGWFRRLACLKHGPDLSDGYFPSNPSASRTRWPPPGMVPRGNGLFARDAQAACCFKWLASKRTSFFQTINVIAANVISLRTDLSGSEISAANICGIRLSDRPSDRLVGAGPAMSPETSRRGMVPQVPSNRTYRIRNT